MATNLLELLNSTRDQATTATDEYDTFTSFFIGYLSNGLEGIPGARREWTEAVQAAKSHVETSRDADARKARQAAENLAFVDELAERMTVSDLVEEATGS